MDGFSFPQVLAIKSCQNLRRYKKKQILFCQNLRRYQKDQKKTKFQKSWGLETPELWFFGTSSGSRGGNLSKKTKKNKVFLGLEENFVFFFVFFAQVLAKFSPLDFGVFGTSSGLAKFSRKILSKPEEVPKQLKFLRPPSPRPPKLCFFCFFGTSTGFGKIFSSRLCFFWYLLRFRQNFP